MAITTAVAAVASLYMSYEAGEKAAAYEEKRVKTEKEAAKVQAAAATESAVAQERAAKEAEEIAAQEAEAKAAEVAEAMRRRGGEQAQTEAAARAKAGASGVASGSMELTIESLMQEHERELAWMKTSGETQTDIIVKQGKTAAGIGRAQASETKSRAKAIATAGEALTSRGDIIKTKALGSMLEGFGTVAKAGEKAKWW